jgi:disulfide bond formation protein DsbB
MTDAIATGLAALAVLLQVLLVLLVLLALAAAVSAPARRLLREVRDTLLGGELWIAWVIALVATLGSLYFSEIAHFEPCRLCWFQRICMYPLAVLLFGMALRRDARNALLYALPLPVIGAGVSTYHEYIVYHPEAETAGCKQGVSCAVVWIEKFGYVQIPTLALTAFLAIAALLALAGWRARETAQRGYMPPSTPTT